MFSKMGLFTKMNQIQCRHTAEYYDEYLVNGGKKIKKEFKCTKCNKILSYEVDNPQYP